MLVEFSVVPMGGDPHISRQIAEAVKIVEASGLAYQLTPAGTCLEGEWGTVFSVIERCHARIREMSPHVVTFIQIEDDQDGGNKLHNNVESVQEKLPIRQAGRLPSTP